MWMWGRRVVYLVLAGGMLLWGAAYAGAQDEKSYVGMDACRKCHGEQYNRFVVYSKKARSFEHIKSLRKGLTESEYRQCFECHTTGYGKPGGFRSDQETPQLKEAGCEVCHGPGSAHVISGDPKDIRANPSVRDCESCHSAERIEAFQYRPMLFGGAH